MKWLIYIGLIGCLLSCKTIEGASIEGQNNKQLFVDELAQLYTIAPNNTIIKHDQDATVQFEYSDNTLGPITNFDVSNPLQLLAFHKNFQTVKIFDRTLTLTSRIDLNKLDLFEIQAVASSNDNRIWIFDELNQELLKIDKNGKVQGRNNDLRLRLSESAAPYKMIEFQNKVYLFDKIHGILIFNNFGEYVSKRLFQDHHGFNYWQGFLFFMSDAGLVYYSLEEDERGVLPLKDELRNGSGYHYCKNNLIYLDRDEIKIDSNGINQ